MRLRLLRRLLPVTADARDGEYAAAIGDDGSVDAEWTRANTPAPGATGVHILPDFPRICTPDSAEFLIARGVRPRHARARVTASRQRYPLTFARTVQTEPARRARAQAQDVRREHENRAAARGAQLAREQFRAEHPPLD